jgi:REP-associated tyrosine transposase
LLGVTAITAICLLFLAKTVQILKACSSKWLNDTGDAGKNFTWQEGYGAFSVSASQTDAVIRYIENQSIHHAKQSFSKMDFFSS